MRNVDLINIRRVTVTQSCPTLGNPMDSSLPGSSVHGDSPGQNTRMGCHAFLQWIFPAQESNPGLLILQVDSLPSEPPGIPDSSAGEESSHNAGDPGPIPGSGRSAGEGTGYPLFLGFSCNSAGKESACNTGDLGLIPGLGRSPGEGNGNLLQYSFLENSWMEDPGRLQSMGLQRVGHD